MIFNVFLDTEIFSHEKNDISSRKLTSLRKYCQIGLVKLYLCDVVVREVKSHLVTELTEQYESIQKKCESKPISLLQKNSVPVVELPDLEQLKERLFRQFDDYLEETDCEIIDSKQVQLPELLDDYFNEVPPFEEKKAKKHEFPDAIIIKAIKSFFQQVPERLYIVSNDGGWKAAFAGQQKYEVIDSLDDMLKTVSQFCKEPFADKYISFLSDHSEEIVERIKDRLENDIDWNEKVGNEVIEADEVFEFEVERIRLRDNDFEYVGKDGATVNLSAEVHIKLQYTYNDYTGSFQDDETGDLYNVASGEMTERHKFYLDLSVGIDAEGEIMDISDYSFDDFDLDDHETLLERKNEEYTEGPDEDYFADYDFSEADSTPF